MASSPLQIPKFDDPANDGVYTSAKSGKPTKPMATAGTVITGGPPGGPTPPPDGRKAIHNEQVKLRATLCNTVAAGFVVAGIITPATAIGAGTAAALASPNQALALMAIWFLGAVILHYSGLLILEATL